MTVRTKIVPPLSSCRSKENQIIGLHKQLERYCNVLPVFGFNSAVYDLDVMNHIIIFTPDSCERTKNRTHCPKEIKPVHVVQIW